MREEFEVWAMAYGLDCDYVGGKSDHRYIHEETRIAFDAWRAARGVALDEQA